MILQLLTQKFLRWFLQNIWAIMAKIKLPRNHHGMVIFWIQLRRAYREFGSKADSIRTNTSGTCFAYSPVIFTVSSCLNGCRTSLKVPSTYQDLALARVFSCSCLAKIRCLLCLTVRSAWKKPGGRHSSTSSKSRSFGSSGQWVSVGVGWQLLLHAQA